MARFVLITGKIGSGKSAVSELLRKKHYIVVDTDKEVKKLYTEDAEMFQSVIEQYGRASLNEDGSFNKEYLVEAMFSKDPEMQEKVEIVTNNVVMRLLQNLERFYEDWDEVIFVEAALTKEVGWCRSYLSMHDVLMVKTDETLRQERLQKRENYEKTKQFEQLQSEDNLNMYRSFGLEQPLDPPDNLIVIENNGSVEELNDRLMVVLEKELKLTHKEKLATYLRYLAECPTYCHDNAWCYSFFNCGGCVNCPFPCANQDKYYKKLQEKFIAEQKKANSKEKKWNEYMDAWADEYNQAQKEIKEYYVTRTARS
ncbi:MAG: dephospho-CoA kinase [Methanobrevibacter sp.]|nr:dephospho-CoA kinase [Methanobrevibacter sp.]